MSTFVDSCPRHSNRRQSLLAVIKITVVVVVFLSDIVSVRAQQCTLPSRIFLPEADNVPFEQLGFAVDVYENYMIAGAHENSSKQVYSGRALIYKLNASNQWIKIAELTPSDPGKYVNFGYDVQIFNNTIVVFGREFDSDGNARAKLYVFNKSSGDEWASSTEDYVITKPFGGPITPTSFGAFELLENELIVIAGSQGKIFMEIYVRSAGIFSMTQSIELPSSASGNSNYSWRLAVGDGFAAISTEQIGLADLSSGAVFVYNKTGATYQTTPAVLKSSDQTSLNWEGFGVAIAASHETLYVQGLKNTGAGYNQTLFVFKIPPGGWIDATKSRILEGPPSVFYDIDMVASDDYVFTVGAGYKSIVGYKRNGAEWNSTATPITFNDLPNDKSLIGYELGLTDTHLVVGCVNAFVMSGTSEEYIGDYYSSTVNWATPGLTHQQIIRETSINATDDFFGETFNVYNNQLAVSASGDDVKGPQSGAVYVFDILKNSSVPDQKIFMPENENYSDFGEAIAMGDSIMFISAPYKDSVSATGTPLFYSIGKVYVYRLSASGWKYASQIIAPVIQSQVCFGRNVVWSKGYCAVTEFYSGSSESVGRVHIYKENPATRKFDYLATLDPATHQRSDFFGKAMVMNDTLMVIGTGSPAPTVANRRSVYVFRKKGEWKNATEDARLYSTDSGWSDRYGASVAIGKDYIIVGSPYAPGFDPRPIPRSYDITGAAYLYKKPAAGWKGTLSETAKLLPSDPTEMGTFGSSVAIDHDDIFIGSPNRFDQYNYTQNISNNDPKLIPGRVYHYKKPAVGGWVSTNQETRKIFSFEPDVIDGYGATMYISDRYLYVGAMFDNTTAGFRTGSVQTLMQLPLIEEVTALCKDGIPVTLSGFPKNGTWSGPGVNTSTGVFSPSVAGPGTHTIVYERSGCEATIQIKVLDLQLNILNQSAANQTKCMGKDISIIFDTEEDASGYRWFFRETADGKFVKYDSLKETIIAHKPGQYEVHVARAACQMHTREFAVADENPVVIVFDDVVSVCNDTELQLSAQPQNGTWTGPSITSSGLFNPGSVQDGIYQEVYEVITPIGCHWKDSVDVVVNKLKQPAMQTSGAEVCNNQPVTLTLSKVDGVSAVKWFEPNGMEIKGQSGLTLKANKAGVYTGEISKGSCSVQVKSAMLIAYADSLFVPNVFSPNSDATNDFFEVKAKGINSFHLFLFNRYGQTLFETDDLNFKWPAEDIPSGTYFWKVNYFSCTQDGKEAKGWVQVVR